MDGHFLAGLHREQPFVQGSLYPFSARYHLRKVFFTSIAMDDRVMHNASWVTVAVWCVAKELPGL